jgi:argininosuccinate synthase
MLEDPAELAPARIFQMTLDPQHAPEKPCKLQINFEHGIILYSMGINFSFFKIMLRIIFGPKKD